MSHLGSKAKLKVVFDKKKTQIDKYLVVISSYQVYSTGGLHVNESKKTIHPVQNPERQWRENTSQVVLRLTSLKVATSTTDMRATV